MNNADFLSHPLTRKEKIWGIGYLIFETFFLALLLQWLNFLLPQPFPVAQLNFVFFVINFCAIAFVFRKFLLGQLKLLPEVVGNAIGIAIVGLVVYFLMNFMLAQVIFAIDPNFFSVNDVAIQELVTENYGLMLFGTVIFVPITEEVLFRGLVFRGLHDHSPILAWIASIVLFSMMHIWGYIGAYSAKTLLLCFLQYLPAGICLAGTYRLSGTILCPILIHAMVNYLSMIALR